MRICLEGISTVAENCTGLIGSVFIFDNTFDEMTGFLGAVCFGYGIEVVDQAVGQLVNDAIYDGFGFLLLQGGDVTFPGKKST